MKLKLVEAAQTIDKMLSSITRVVFPVFEKYGFTFSSGLPRYRTRFSVKFSGTYKDDVITVPCTLEINTTHESIESYNRDVGKFNADAFMRLILSTKTINLGAVEIDNSKSVDEVIRLNLDEINSVLQPRKDISLGVDNKKSTKQEPEVDEDLIKFSQSSDDQGERTPLTDEEQEVAKSLKGDYVYSSANSFNLIPAKNDSSILRTMRDWVVIDKIEGDKGGDSYKTFYENVLPDEYKEFLANLKPQNTPDLKSIGELIKSTLSNYGVKVSYVGGLVGPSITQYEFTLGSGVRINDVSNLSKEIAMTLGVTSVYVTPITGKNSIGIQVPNAEISAVSLDDVLEDMDKSGLAVALGKDTNGNAQSADILKLQHVLIGGTTGCVDKDTEFFNGFGWKPISEYEEGDKVLVYHEDGKATLEYPQAFIKESADIFYHVKPKYGMDMMLSPEHNVYYITSKGNLYHRTMKEIADMHFNSVNGFTGKFIHTFNYEGEGVDLSDSCIKVMLAVMADGNFFNDTSRCRINLKKNRKKIELRNILLEANIEYDERVRSDGYSEFYFNSPVRIKHFDSSWYNCNKYQLEVIADNVCKWDGCVSKSTKRYFSTCKTDADFIQFVFSSLGFKSSITEDNRVGKKHSNGDYAYKSVCYCVHISNGRSLTSIVNSHGRDNIDILVKSNEYKYCFTTSTGMWVLRRNGFITITGNSGKSSAINSMLCSLIQQYSPDDVKLVLIDPKQVELSSYKNVPHLLRPIITDAKEADSALKDLTEEMDERYTVFSKTGVRDIKGYNSLVDNYNKSHEHKLPHMPYIVCVIDELADLMSVAGKSVETSIQRITQKARAAGIHMIVATQRPSTDVVTGTIKSNLPSRIAFSTASNTDSRTILDQGGAEKLLGKGDMLYKPVGATSPTRIQGAFVPDEQVDAIVKNVINKYKK